MLNATEWLVVFAGAGLIAWVNWYFFLAGRFPGPQQQVAQKGGIAAENRGSSHDH